MNVLITIPVYNEEKIIKEKILYLDLFLSKNFKYKYKIEIVDNNSKDNTRKIAKDLSKKNKNVSYLFLKKQGKGIAIKKSWNRAKGKFNVFSFMDLDLSTDLSSFNQLIDSILINDYDISVGSRYEKKSFVKRSFKRSFFAKSYIFIQKLLFKVPYKDSQCGYKAIKPEVYFNLKKYFSNFKLNFDKTDMFFDTELLILANYFNYKIKSVPVKWYSGKESHVTVLRIVFIFFIYLIYFRFYMLFLKSRF